MKKIIKELIPYLVIIVVVVFVRTFIVTPVRVSGPSMNPTLEDKDILLLKKFDKSYERFDIVVFNYNNEKLIKRVIGLPGEKIEYKENKLYINGKEIYEEFLVFETSDFSLSDIGYEVIPDNMYFLVGDNRNNSLDSRMIGLIKEDDITGTIGFSIFPFKKIEKY